jgi:competence protein ComEC
MTGEPENVETIPPAYGGSAAGWRQPLPGALVAAVTVAVAVGAWTARPAAAATVAGALGVAALAWSRDGRVVLVGVAVAVGAVAGQRSRDAWESLRPEVLGAHTGWVTVASDPAPAGAAVRVLVDVDGQRHEVWVRGRAGQVRARAWRAGERLLVHGERVALRPDRIERVAWQHVVAELRIEWVADVAPGTPLATAVNRVRDLIARGGASMDPTDAALYRGLVMGDDRDQPSSMIERFRASGLSHLTAVSGQNVAFVLAAAGPLLTRLRPGWRLVVTLGLVAWFVTLTRFEPSILRAGAMAALSAIAFATGRERAPARLLAIAVTALLLVDPLLVRAIGFWLSVGATAGVTVVAPMLAGVLAPLGRLAGPAAVTLGAQVGVLVPSTLVFGLPPIMSIPANLLAVPVAGAVMLVGLPAGLLAGATDGVVPWLGPVTMAPVAAGVRWVDTVAALGARLEPGGAATTATWALLGLTLVCAAAWRTAAGRRAAMATGAPRM